MKTQLTKLTAACTVAMTFACASQQGMSTQSQSSSNIPMGTDGSGMTASNSSSGMWVDSTGGMWMDGSGAMRMGGRDGMMMGLSAADISSMSNSNIVAHLSTGDSLEVALSRIGASRAQNSAVRNFAQRMVNEHSAHRQMGMQIASQNGITPAPSPADTADIRMANRMSMRLTNASTNSAYDRQFMRAEVMMHQHMLHELTMLRPQASGAAAQLIDQTIPVVQQHLSMAQSVWRQVGGGMNNNNSNNSSTSGQ